MEPVGGPHAATAVEDQPREDVGNLVRRHRRHVQLVTTVHPALEMGLGRCPSASPPPVPSTLLGVEQQPEPARERSRLVVSRRRIQSCLFRLS